MAGPWDSMMKKMVRANPDHFVKWLLPDATFISEENIELENQHRFADALLLVKKRGRYGLLHLEFQTYPDPEMGKRLLEYNVMAWSQYNLPVFTYVIYLVNTGDVPEPPFIRTFLDDETVHHFFYRPIRLWEQEAETIMQVDWSGVWPLLPLTKGGKRPEVVKAMIDWMAEAKEYDLLALAQIVGGLAFQKGAEREAFRRMFKMFQDVLRESWVYQEIGLEYLEKGLEKGLEQGLEKGLEKGRSQALHQMLLTYIETRFPELTALAQQQTNSMTDPEMLNQIISKLFALQTIKEAEQYLLTLDNDTTKN